MSDLPSGRAGWFLPYQIPGKVTGQMKSGPAPPRGTGPLETSVLTIRLPAVVALTTGVITSLSEAGVIAQYSD
ncbi:hypothetical protein Pla111_12590 [Botrimarina hoheduenensis]|uniref:Uncharacterized protein n=1 Tax=Botrimarina hoheduenensis TaxID=2528000 RepID=A0A5C5WBN3_9BACT|nr:hypothetical protein Pla111_12590 [Botrimarina hoheduenensis]